MKGSYINLNSAKINSFSQNQERMFFLKRLPIYLTRSLIRKMKGYERSKEFVKENYDIARQKFFESAVWEKANSLEEFELIDFNSLQLDTNPLITCKLNGNLCKTRVRTFIKLANENFKNSIQEFIQPEDEIVELGTGFGYRLFMLKKAKIKNKMSGFDVSESGIKACKKMDNYFKTNIEFNILDLTSDFDPSILKNKVVFTYHAFEQLNHYTEDVIKKIIEGKPKQVLHFEPVIELYKNKICDIASKVFLHYNDYQDNLLTTLQKFERLGHLKVTHAYRLGYSENPYNETSFLRWTIIDITSLKKLM